MKRPLAFVGARLGFAGARLAFVGARLGFVVALAIGLAGCGIAARTVPIPTAEPTPVITPSMTLEVTRLQVESALRAASLAVIVPQVPFRPGESTALAAAPRLVLQAVLAGDPTHGFIVVYDFPDAGTAWGAGNEMAHYLASGPGRVQFPPDAEHVLRQVGSTLVFFTWSPENSSDPREADVATALSSLGAGIPIRR
jgi:hypothetical protein